MLIRTLALPSALLVLASAPSAAQGFGPPTWLTTFDKDVSSLAIGDLDGDGRADIAVAASTGNLGGDLWVLLAQPSGDFGSPVSLTFGDVCGLRMVDLDGDGDQDLVALRNFGTCPELVWYENDGSGLQFQFHVIQSCASAGNTCIEIRAVDFDNDGDLDLATTALNGFCATPQLNPGSFGNTALIDLFPGNSRSMAVGDFDFDGVPEFFAARASSSLFGDSWAMRTLEPPTVGGWQSTPWSQVESAQSAVALENTDSGGDDLVVHDIEQARIARVFRPLNPFAPLVDTWLDVPGDVGPLSGSDLDGDGDTDVLLPWIERDELIWLPNLGSGAQSNPLLIADGLDGLLLAAAGDLSGNGLPDVVVVRREGSFSSRLELISNFGQPDCNGNGQDDYLDVLQGLAEDCNGNGFLDVCEVLDPGADVNGNGVPDECELALTSVSPDGGPWHSANTLTLGGAFDTVLPLQVRIGDSGPFDAQVLDANSAQLVLAPSSVGEVGSLTVTVLQDSLQQSLPFAWAPTPALNTETTGSLSGGG
ncbi:MAG: FG-GAP-like repeat-containing protein, partial [Planctomycetota bacterium]